MKLSSLVSSVLPLAAATNIIAPPTATVESGPLVGVQTTLPGALGPVNKFLGIPYGTTERFCLARKPLPWKTPRKASEFGASCSQYIPHSAIATDYELMDEIFNFLHPRESEDCLFVNVFAPAAPAPPGGRPVVLSIHGGGWIQGNGQSDLSGFAGYEDIIAISFNYRTNVLGFPNSPDIPLAQRNLGLHDQFLALKWVQANVHAFGGDASKVTLWGESAGSISVDIHLLSSANPPPFRAAMMFSGQFSFGRISVTPNASDHTQWNNIAKAVGCASPKSQLSCMRNVPVKQLTQALEKVGAFFSPLVDGLTVPAGRAKAWRSGNVAKVPILTGTIKDEGRALVNSKISWPLFEQVYMPERLVSKKQRDAILSYYKTLPHLKTDFDLAAAIYTDMIWQCPQGRLANISASLPSPTWRYNFNISITDILPPKFRYLQKFHGSDVVLLFIAPTFEGKAVPGMTPELYAFANYFRGIIGRFVRNPTAGPGWPAVGSEYAPWDVAVLGDVGETHAAGATPVDHRSIDERCFLFEDIYRLLEFAS